MIIINAEIYTMEGESFKRGCVWIENGKIKKIAEVINIDGEKIIDADGRMLFPGFIDAHSHLGMWEDGVDFEGADGNEATDPITPQLRAIDAINPMDRTFEEAYQGGITATSTGPGSANVISGQFAVIKTYGKRIDDMIMKEPAAIKCAFGENPKKVYGDQHKSPSTRMATAALLRETLMEAKDYLEKKESDDEDKHPDYDMQMEALIPLLKKEIPLKAHAHRADDIFTAIRIAKEFDLNMTLDHCTEGHLITEYLKDENMPAIVGPSFSERSKVELRNLTFETPGVLNKAGIKVAIMTDHPVIPIQYLTLCAALAAKAGLDKQEALKAITIYAAEILGVSDRIGSLKEGKDADMVLWDGHPFDIESKVNMTIIDGKIVYNSMEN
ncbi:MAG: amidohydrolase [Clostridia bacterium]|nr:amidohydrolase [Clostridia bacterium]